MFWRSAVLFVLLTSPTLAAQQFALKNALVENNPQRPKYLSGILHTVTRIEARAHAGAHVTLYHTFLTVDQFEPTRGDHCDFTYELHAIPDAIVGDGSRIPQGNVMLIDNLSCR